MKKATNTPIVLPMIPLRDILVFPHMAMNIEVDRRKSAAAIQRAMLDDQRIFLVMQKSEETDDPKTADLHKAGTIAKIQQIVHMSGGELRVLIIGEARASFENLLPDEETWMAEIIPIPGFSPDELTPEIESLIRLTKESVQNLSEVSGKITNELSKAIQKISNPDELVDVICANVLDKKTELHELLSIKKVQTRLEKLCVVLAREAKNAVIDRTIQIRVKMQVDKSQREFYLREQMKAIQDELGESDDDGLDEIREKLEKLPLNKEAKEKADKEMKRLVRTAEGSPEGNVSENYLEWLCDLPWGVYTKDQVSLSRARKILDKDHYGMEKVKQRVIEHLAVLAMRLKSDPKASLRGPILCFVGPPGVGKTSIVKGIAQALGRKFVKISLGGLRDDAEIYGHRRTYIGAIPGHVMLGMKRSGSMNPVFLFDEIDKMGSDYRGDPASAMLEVLDSEQNAAFRDHYLDIPFDLSRVLFVTTANTTETIPAPLRDRMEIIEVPSYTEEEKLQIAKKHLLKKQLEENGLPGSCVSINYQTLKLCIENYTREAGVRSLSRVLNKIVRQAAAEMLENDIEKVQVNPTKLEVYLGPPHYLRDKLVKEPLVGVVNGLAYTEIGGEMLQVECAVMPGTGKLSMTGSLGEVMKESAQAALTWVRAHGLQYGIDPEFYQKQDIHIHVPEGAVPKDGPSAGVAMALALSSALSKRPVRQDMAMTGEITLNGRVLPIGGLKEKIFAAYRAGIKCLAIPAENQKDVSEIPVRIKEAFQIEYVKHVQQVIDLGLLEV